MSGSYTGEEINVILSFSPLIGLLYWFTSIIAGLRCRGDTTGEENNFSTLVLPSMNRNPSF